MNARVNTPARNATKKPAASGWVKKNHLTADAHMMIVARNRPMNSNDRMGSDITDHAQTGKAF